MKRITNLDGLIGRNIRMNRRQRRMTQRALADAISLNYQQLQKYERGVSRIAATNLYLISLVLQVPFESFFAELVPGGDGHP